MILFNCRSIRDNLCFQYNPRVVPIIVPKIVGIPNIIPQNGTSYILCSSKIIQSSGGKATNVVASTIVVINTLLITQTTTWRKIIIIFSSPQYLQKLLR